LQQPQTAPPQRAKSTLENTISQSMKVSQGHTEALAKCQETARKNKEASIKNLEMQIVITTSSGFWGNVIGNPKMKLARWLRWKLGKRSSKKEWERECRGWNQKLRRDRRNKMIVLKMKLKMSE